MPEMSILYLRKRPKTFEDFLEVYRILAKRREKSLPYIASFLSSWISYLEALVLGREAEEPTLSDHIPGNYYCAASYAAALKAATQAHTQRKGMPEILKALKKGLEIPR